MRPSTYLMQIGDNIKFVHADDIRSGSESAQSEYHNGNSDKLPLTSISTIYFINAKHF